MAVLYFLCSVLVGKKKPGNPAPSVEPFFLRAIDDLEICTTFPWGRLTFDKNMKDIFHCIKHFGGVLSTNQWVFPSFVIPLEVLAFEAIPVLKENFREGVSNAHAHRHRPRMCKMKFKASKMKRFSLKEICDKLGTTKDTESILTPSSREKRLLGRIMDEESRYNDVDDPVVYSWTKCLIDEEKTIWFEELYNQDLATRETNLDNRVKFVESYVKWASGENQYYTNEGVGDMNGGGNGDTNEGDKEQAEMEQTKKDKFEREQAEREQAEREQAEKEQAEKEQSERAKTEKNERAKAEKAERAEWAKTEKVERAERAKTEKAERAKAEKAERPKAEKARAEKDKAERAKADKAERAKAEKDKADKEQADKAERAKADEEHAEKEQTEKEKAEKSETKKEKVDEEKTQLGTTNEETEQLGTIEEEKEQLGTTEEGREEDVEMEHGEKEQAKEKGEKREREEVLNAHQGKRVKIISKKKGSTVVIRIPDAPDSQLILKNRKPKIKRRNRKPT
ncbi:uncharacterized protein At3g43530-like [Capsella rubella]|uniref:uncharacterized protein At3g43530-like n=1 Tax=Capsella rubella TaxID=81985 RepID=UPI000CD57541|nr:uncharacterized protein At3g43530-like [Capsella rubella]